MGQNLTWAIGFSNQILSHRICHIGLRKKTDPFIRSKSKYLKLGIGSRKNLPYFDVTLWWYLVVVVPTLPMCSVRGYFLPNFPKCPVPDRYRRYRYWCRTELTEVSGTGIEVVPNLPKGPVPVLMSYGTYRSVWYRYSCSTELTEVSGTSFDVVPNLSKCPVQV